ncbi:hypothetical protein ACHAXR_009874 [Thalassiosira sp. AJA248-18]
MENNTFDPVGFAVAIAILTSILIFVYDALFGKNKNSTPSVREITIYPIKSCAETQVDSAIVTPRGFQHDRIFQVVSKNADNAYNFCTPRDVAFEKLFHVKPTLLDDGKRLKLTSPHKQDALTLKLKGAPTDKLSTTAMGYCEVVLDDYGDEVSKWLNDATDIHGNPRLVGIGPDGFHRSVQVNPDQGEELPATPSPIPVSLADEAPFLLTTRESLAALNKQLASKGKDAVDMRRFRPNIVIDGLHPWEEDSMKRIRIGSVEFHVWQRCGRCTMTTIDRDTLKRGGEPLSTLSSFRERKNGQRNFGMHLIPVLDNDGVSSSGEDMIKVGDKVEVLEYDDERRAEWTRLFWK